MTDTPADAITAMLDDIAQILHGAGCGDEYRCVDLAERIYTAAAPALYAQGAAAERADAELRIADAVATEFCRIRALAKKVRAVYPNPGADRGPLREALKRPPYLPFAGLLDADLPEET